MARQHAIRIPKARDSTVVEFFEKLRDECGLTSAPASLFGTTERVNLLSKSSEVESILDVDGTSIQSADVDLTGLKIIFRRQIYVGDHLEPSAIYDEIELEPIRGANPPFSADHALSVTGIVKQLFQSNFTSANPVFAEGSPYGDILRSHQEIIANFERHIADIGQKLIDERFKNEKEVGNKRTQLESQYNNKLAELEKQKARLDSEFSAQTDELNRQRKEIDDRNNTHARRALRQDLKERLRDHSSGFKLTKDTITLRRPIHVITGFSLAVLGGLVFYYASKAASDTITNERLAFLIVKSLGVTVAFIGLLTWYLRWMNRWFETHASAEFQLKQLELDIDRASWVVETALEWRNEQGNTIPEHLMESISRNLFSKTEKDEGADMNPVDHLASVLLGSASALKLKVGENEINLDRKAIREAAKG